MSAGLFLIFLSYLDFLADRLTVRNTRLGQDNLYLVLGKQLAGNDIEVHITHAVEKHLMVFLIVEGTDREILFHHLLQALCYLVDIALVLRVIALVGVRNADRCLLKYKRIILQ